MVFQRASLGIAMNRYRTHLLLRLAAVIVGGSVTATPAYATNFQWINPNGGSWETMDNWSPQGYPRFIFDFAVFGLAASYNVNATNAALVPGLGGIQVRSGNVSLDTHDSFRAVFGVGTSGSPAAVSLSGAIIGAGTHVIGPTGTLTLEPGSKLESTGTGAFGFNIDGGGTLRGDGGSLERKVLRSFGTVSPGLAPGTAGILRIGAIVPAGYVQRETGVLEIEIGGPAPGTSYDQLRVENIISDVSLNGTLRVTLINGYLPSSGSRFDILTAPSIIGAFTNVSMPSLPGFEFSVVYEPTKVTVVATRLLQTYSFDIRPSGCPNPLNVRTMGIVPTALIGGIDLDVHTIDVATLRLEGVSPDRWSYEDVSPSYAGDICECSKDGPDGVEDMTIKFSAPDLVAAIGPVVDGEERLLTLTGNLLSGEPFEASDCVLIHARGGTGPRGRVAIFSNSAAWEPQQWVTYELPDAAEVSLGVYNVSGRQVAEVVRATQTAGVHTVEWNAGQIPAGIYFYRLEAGALAGSAKIMLFR